MIKKIIVVIMIMVLFVPLSGCNEQKKYDEAVQYYEDGKDAEALNIFQKIEDYEDSSKYINAIKDPKGMIIDLCANYQHSEVRSYSSILPTNERMSYDIRIDEETRSFACVRESALTVYLDNQMKTKVNLEYYMGFVGHFDGPNPKIDNHFEIEGEGKDAQINEFWTQYWKK